MPVVDIKGVGKAQFPDNMDINNIREFLRNKYYQDTAQGVSRALDPAPQAAAPVEASLADKAGQAVADFLFDKGIITDRYRAQETGRTLSALAEFLPGIGDATAGDEFGRAVAQGDKLGMGLAALGVIPVAGDTAKRGVKSLYKVHNVTEEGLQKANEFGGIPVPSLAVAGSDEGFESFGDISLVGTKGAFSKDPTFASDVYSPRFPQSFDEINSKALKDEIDRIESSVPAELKDRVRSDFYAERIKEDIDRLKESQPNKAAYLDSIGFGVNPSDYKSSPDIPKRTMPEYFDRYYGDGRVKINRLTIHRPEFERDAARWFNDNPIVKEAMPEFFVDGKINEDGKLFVARILRRESMEDDNYKKGPVFDRNKMIKEIDERISKHSEGFQEYINNQKSKLSKGKKFTKWNPKTATSKTFDFNLDNAVKLMKGQIRGGEGFSYGVGNIRAQVAPQLKSLSQIQNRRGQIVGEDQMTMVKEGFESRLENLYNDLSEKWSWGASPSYSEFAEGIQSAARGDYSDFKNLTSDDKSELQSFFDELANAPTNYFEIKPQRAVSINEFYGAAVPEGTNKDVIESLKAQGLEVETYKPEERKEAIKRLNIKSGGNIFFSGAGAAIFLVSHKEEDQQQ